MQCIIIEDSILCYINKAMSQHFLRGNLLKTIEVAGKTLVQTRDEISEKCKLESKGEKSESSQCR